MKTWFHKFGFKFNLYRYASARAAGTVTRSAQKRLRSASRALVTAPLSSAQKRVGAASRTAQGALGSAARSVQKKLELSFADKVGLYM
jgi:hypothetical protein